MPPGHEGIDSRAGLPLAWAANVECCCVSFSESQEGQVIWSPPRRTSFSNFVPHWSQAYSKIGMILFYSLAEPKNFIGSRTGKQLAIFGHFDAVMTS